MIVLFRVFAVIVPPSQVPVTVGSLRARELGKLSVNVSPVSGVFGLVREKVSPAIRPAWRTLGDVVGEKLIYDAPTAHGGSGGPVFDTNGEVIGVNSAYMDGFSGGTLGVSVDSLRPLIQDAQTAR